MPFILLSQAVKPYKFISPCCSITARTELRNNLQCKSFSWYLENVYRDLHVPDADDMAFGAVSQGQYCLDTLGSLNDGRVGIYSCHGTGGNQEWSFTRAGQIKHADLCLTLEEAREGTRLKLKMCNNALMQVW